MTQDYAPRRRPASRRKSYQPSIPAWVWLFTGGVLGAFIMFLMHLSRIEPAESSGPAIVEDILKVAPVASNERPKLRFTFPQLLRDSTVKVPDAPEITPDAQADADMEYLLQVASFQDIQDAEQVRAELILLNMQASIEEPSVLQGKTWHRVVVGPFVSRSQLSKARSTLISNNFGALVRKRPASPDST